MRAIDGHHSSSFTVHLTLCNKKPTKKMKNRYPSITAVALILLPLFSAAQKVVAFQQSTVNSTFISGTSTLHDWTMTSTEASYEAKFEMSGEGKPIQLQSLSYSLPAESLKSGKNAMDKNAYSALNTSKHKKITFVLTHSKIEGSTIRCNGNLTIAGVTKPVTLEASYKVGPNGDLTCNAKFALKMTDFNVEPPTFMLGTIKTGDELTLTFSINLTPAKS
jgi:polyisoprenoid-binding protein YceI